MKAWGGRFEGRPDPAAAELGRSIEVDSVLALDDVDGSIAHVTGLERAGLPCPEVRSCPAGLPHDGSWLVKPLASAGGTGIRPLGPGDDPGGPCYYQRRIDGTSLSAVFVASRERAELVRRAHRVAGVLELAGDVQPDDVVPLAGERDGGDPALPVRGAGDQRDGPHAAAFRYGCRWSSRGTPSASLKTFVATMIAPKPMSSTSCCSS